jgi:taurine dioxygenase
MPIRRIEVRPLSGSIGAEIHGVDLSRELGQETFAEIHQVFLDHLAIFFRDQHLAPEQQIAFAGRFGPPIHDPFMKGAEGRPELVVVIKEKNERAAFGEVWHSDSTFLEKPPLASTLYAREIPSYGGDTIFANQYLAYESLSPGLRKTLDGMKAVHAAVSYNDAIADGTLDDRRAMKLRKDAVMKAAMESQAEHPVVRTNPETRRKALFVNPAYVVRFKDWTEAESRPLLEYLYAHMVRPEFTCRFRWSVDALALWDNRCALHHPVNDYHGRRRIMHRVLVQGERPF